METTTFTVKEKQEILKLFGVPPEQLDLETFHKIHRELRSKFHPDNFEQFENEAIREMATERFQHIEELSSKIETWLTGAKLFKTPSASSEETFMRDDAIFAGKRIKIEILTSDKDLKYHLFGSFYRWLEYGESFKIPGTKTAHLVADESYQGRRIGYQESVRLYLTFGEDDAIEDIVDWFFPKISGRVNSLIIAGNGVRVEPFEMIRAIRKESFLRLGSGVEI